MRRKVIEVAGNGATSQLGVNQLAKFTTIFVS